MGPPSREAADPASAADRGHRASAGRWRRAAADGGQPGHERPAGMRRPSPPDGVGAVPPQHPDEHVGRQPPPASLDRRPATRPRAPASRDRASASAGRPRRASIGRASVGARPSGTAGAAVGSRPAGRPCRRRRSRACGPTGSAPVRRRRRRRAARPAASGGSRRSVPSRDAVTSSCQWSVTEPLRSLARGLVRRTSRGRFPTGTLTPRSRTTGRRRGPTSRARSARWTVSGTAPSSVHSTVTSTGSPADAASRRRQARHAGRPAASAPVASVRHPPVAAAVPVPPGASPGRGRPTARRRSTAPITAHAPATVDSRRGGHRVGGRVVVHARRRGARPTARGSGAGRPRCAVPDDERVVERLAVGGEGEDHRPPAAVAPAQPRAAHLDAILARVAAPGDDPRVGRRAPRPARRPGAPASRRRWRPRRRAMPGARRTRRPAWARRCRMPSSASTISCQSGRAPTTPARRRTRLASAPARASTRRAASVVPRGVAGQSGIGEAGAQPVVEPAVELDEPCPQAGDALVASLRSRSGAAVRPARRPRRPRCRRSGRGRRRRSGPWCGLGAAGVSVDPRGRPPAARRWPGPGRGPTSPAGRGRACTAAIGSGTSIATPRRRGRPSCRRARARSPATPPRRPSVGAERRPPGRHGERLGRRERAGFGASATTCSIDQRFGAPAAVPTPTAADVTDPLSHRPRFALSDRARTRTKGRSRQLNVRSCTPPRSPPRSRRSSSPSCRTRRCWRRSSCRRASSGRSPVWIGAAAALTAADGHRRGGRAAARPAARPPGERRRRRPVRRRRRRALAFGGEADATKPTRRRGGGRHRPSTSGWRVSATVLRRRVPRRVGRPDPAGDGQPGVHAVRPCRSSSAPRRRWSRSPAIGVIAGRALLRVLPERLLRRVAAGIFAAAWPCSPRRRDPG